MFLPATFHWGFGTQNYPKGFDIKHGDGFKIDRKRDKVISKFTSGVATLLSPFYGFGVIIDQTFNLQNHPYSRYYLFFVSLGSTFYFVLGFYFFRKWLQYYVNDVSSFWTAITLLLATNLTYYTMDENLMSHLYSFTLFTILLYNFKTFNQSQKFKHFIYFSSALSFAILIRPTNALFLPIALLLDVHSLSSLRQNIQPLLTFKNIVLGVFIFILIISPQMIYWKFAYEKYLVWSYSGEGFTLWNQPNFLITWFSPQSGLLPYVPVFILSIVFWVIMYRKKEKNIWLILFTFIVVSYMCASWHNPFFGMCNFGKRPMIEFYPILFLPVAYMFSYYSSYSDTLKKIILGSLFIFSYYHLTLFGVFDTCFYGDIWDWNSFGTMVKKGIVLIR
jgi:hypothetical protein